MSLASVLTSSVFPDPVEAVERCWRLESNASLFGARSSHHETDDEDIVLLFRTHPSVRL